MGPWKIYCIDLYQEMSDALRLQYFKFCSSILQRKLKRKIVNTSVNNSQKFPTDSPMTMLLLKHQRQRNK